MSYHIILLYKILYYIILYISFYNHNQFIYGIAEDGVLAHRVLCHQFPSEMILQCVCSDIPICWPSMKLPLNMFEAAKVTPLVAY